MLTSVARAAPRFSAISAGGAKAAAAVKFAGPVPGTQGAPTLGSMAGGATQSLGGVLPAMVAIAQVATVAAVATAVTNTVRPQQPKSGM